MSAKTKQFFVNFDRSSTEESRLFAADVAQRRNTSGRHCRIQFQHRPGGCDVRLRVERATAGPVRPAVPTVSTTQGSCCCCWPFSSSAGIVDDDGLFLAGTDQSAHRILFIAVTVFCVLVVSRRNDGDDATVFGRFRLSLPRTAGIAQSAAFSTILRNSGFHQSRYTTSIYFFLVFIFKRMSFLLHFQLGSVSNGSWMNSNKDKRGIVVPLCHSSRPSECTHWNEKKGNTPTRKKNKTVIESFYLLQNDFLFLSFFFFYFWGNEKQKNKKMEKKKKKLLLLL